MQRVMDYMKERELRPTELFRSFDKAVKSKLTKQQFAARIQVTRIVILTALCRYPGIHASQTSFVPFSVSFGHNFFLSQDNLRQRRTHFPNLPQFQKQFQEFFFKRAPFLTLNSQKSISRDIPSVKSQITFFFVRHFFLDKLYA